VPPRRLEQHRAQLAFDAADRFRQRRLRDAERDGGGAEGRGVGRGHQDFELPHCQVHGIIL